MIRSLLSRTAGPLLLGALAASGSLRAQSPAPARHALAGDDAPSQLGEYVVSATRSPQDPRLTSSAVTLLPLADLAVAQVGDLRGALAREAGVIVVNTGVPGGPSSVFLRGGSSHQTLFVVDGVRMNDRSASYTTFLGAADLAGVDRVEVLRGPQSTLYGSSAMGGVIVVDTTRGCAPTTGALTATGGSFDTYGASAAVKGGTRTIGYSAAVAGLRTANDRPNNDLEQGSFSTRLEAAPTTDVLVGGTLRSHHSTFEQTGSRFFSAPGEVDHDNYLSTAYAQVRAGDVTSRLTAAVHRRIYDWTDRSGSPWATNSALRNTRKILDWQNTWTATPEVELVAGANYERSRYTIDGNPSKDEVRAGYVSGTARPLETVALTAGARYDHFDSVGDATTWRSGASWRALPGTKMRATYGTGFSAPGSDDRFGVPAWGQLPNPNLQPEKSRGWDIGIDQELAGGRVQLAATWFKNRFRNLFAWETVDFVTFQGRTVNSARATTEGIEFAITARPIETVQTRLSYTYLDAFDDSADDRLTRRPRRTIDAEIRLQALDPWIVGVGAHRVADRVERQGAALQRMPDYTTVRLFTSYAVRPDLTLKLRVENALDKEYEEVLGYPSLPRAAFGSVEWLF
jgi:vitamin B12 transporter